MRRTLVSSLILFPCLALSLIACGESSSTQSSGSGGTGTSSGDGGHCSVPHQDDAAVACSALVQFNGPGLSKSFKSGVLTDVKADGATIDGGADGEVKFRWAGGDLAPIFAVGDAVTAIEEGPSGEGYTGIESTKARAVVAYTWSNTSASPPKPFTLAPQLVFSLTPECSWTTCEAGCSGVSITTKLASLVITVGGAPVTLKTGETGTVDGVVVHHGAATDGLANDPPPSCAVDFTNEVTFTLLQKLP